MARPPSQPSYRRHKARDCAVVTLNGRNHYLGPWQSPESHERYAALIAEWTRNNGVLPAPALPAESTDTRLTVSDLVLAYFRFAQAHYVRGGDLTSEVGCLRQALRPVRRLYGSTPAAEFGPRALQNVRADLVAAGRARASVNKDVHRVRRMFRWAVGEELLPAGVYERLRCVAALAAGKTAARETARVLPAPAGDVEATLPHLPPPVAAMAQVQLLTGARPQEVAHLRPGDVTEAEGGVWHYTPAVVEEYLQAGEADWRAVDESAVGPAAWAEYDAALGALETALAPPLGRLLGLARRLAAVVDPAPSDHDASDPAYVAGCLGPFVARLMASPDATPLRGLPQRLDAVDPVGSAERLHRLIWGRFDRPPPVPEPPVVPVATEPAAAPVSTPADQASSAPPAASAPNVRPLTVHTLELGEDWGEFDRLKNEIDPCDGYLGQSVAILRLYLRIEQLNRRPEEPVAIVGPSGVGKTALARLVHGASGRRKNGWQRIAANDMIGGNDSVRRSKFPGFGKNSGISGVDKDAQASGWLRDCAGGTLFIDEMHDLDEASTGSLRPVFGRSDMWAEGGVSPAFKPDVRLVFATHMTEAELRDTGTAPARLPAAAGGPVRGRPADRGPAGGRAAVRAGPRGRAEVRRVVPAGPDAL